jgi:hypothetical protein
MTYPWYEVVKGDEISQGDIIENCPVVIVPPVGDIDAGDELEVIIQTIDVIVMTQACDLEQGNVNDVILCGVSNANEVKTKNGKTPDIGFFKDIKNGRNVSLHLLNEYDGKALGCNHRIVDLRQLYSLPLNTLKAIAKKRGARLRLLPPYREHLSQAFARVFMRVGLPSDIDITKIEL